MSISEVPQGHLKKSIRDVTRLLSRPNLPADIRREQERKLAHLKISLQDREVSQREHTLHMRYKKVRFFESKKAERKLTHAAAALVDDANSANLANYVSAKLNSIYIHAFPANMKYVSLFPSAPCVNEQVLAFISEMKLKLAAQNDFTENITLDDATAMAKADLANEGPTKVSSDVAGAVEGANLKLNEAFAKKSAGRRGSDEDDSEVEDDEDEDVSDDGEDGSDVSDEEGIDDDSEGSENDFDQDGSSDDDSEGNDSEDDGEDVDSEDDEDLDSEDDMSDSDDNEVSGDESDLQSEDGDDDDEDDDDEGSESEEEGPKQKKHRRD